MEFGRGQQQQQNEQQKGHQEPIFKHYCKVCKRGFGCAGALGGHMRSHSVGDARWSTNNNQFSSNSLNGDTKEFGIGNNLRSNVHPDHHHHQGESRKHSYFLRTNTNRFMSNYRSSFSDDHHVRGDNINQNRSLIARHGIVDNVRAAGKYLSPMSSSESEVEEVDHMIIKSRRIKSDTVYQDHDHDRHCYASSEEEDLANCLVMLSNRSFVQSDDHTNKVQGANKVSTNHYVGNNKGLFQCKACKKVFNSHQALGGHRASHKKVKGCYASRFDNNDDKSIREDDLIINQLEEKLHFHQSENSSDQPATAGVIDFDYSPNHNHDQLPKNTNHASTLQKPKSHQCSICQRVFSSGQALGGHKRCHWLTSNLPDSSIIQNLQDFNIGNAQQLYKKPSMLQLVSSSTEATQLDLNFPPMLNNAADNLNMGSYYEAPARSFLQLWKNEDQQVDKKRGHHQQQLKCAKSTVHDLKNDEEGVEEDECRMKKIAKLSDLKESDWLQVGIASTTHV